MKRTQKKLLGVCAAVLAIAGALTLDSMLRLVITEYSLSFADLPEGCDGMRIVQLSDLHGMSFGKDNLRLVEKIRELRPDLIVLTGDFIDRKRDLDVMETLCTQLVELAPVYFCSGNHDWRSGRIRELAALLSDCGVGYLRNDYEVLLRGGDSFVLAGVEDPNGPADMSKPDELAGVLDEEQPDSFRILLAHRNDWPEKYPDLPVDLIFSGHGHGGVIRLPGGIGVLGNEHSIFPKYDDGVFESGRCRMVVSRGLGGNSVLLIPRFLNNPEIVCVTLHKG